MVIFECNQSFTVNKSRLFSCRAILAFCLSVRYLQIRYSNKTMIGGEKLPFHLVEARNERVMRGRHLPLIPLPPPRPKLGRPAGVNIFFEILPQSQIMIK